MRGGVVVVVELVLVELVELVWVGGLCILDSVSLLSSNTIPAMQEFRLVSRLLPPTRNGTKRSPGYRLHGTAAGSWATATTTTTITTNKNLSSSPSLPLPLPPPPRSSPRKDRRKEKKKQGRTAGKAKAGSRENACRKKKTPFHRPQCPSLSLPLAPPPPPPPLPQNARPARPPPRAAEAAEAEAVAARPALRQRPRRDPLVALATRRRSHALAALARHLRGR